MLHDKINRKVAPQVAWSDTMAFPAFTHERLVNGVDLYTLVKGTVPAVKVQIFFPGGAMQQPKPLVASAAMAMLAYGTEQFTYEEFATKVDALGARMSPSTSMLHSRLSLTCTVEQLQAAWGLFEDCLLHPRCEEKNFSTWVAKQRSQAEIRMQESNYLAVRGLQETLLMGNALGMYANLEDYDNLALEDIHAYHRDTLRANHASVIVSGGLNPVMMSWVRSQVEQLGWDAPAAPSPVGPTVDFAATPASLKLTEAPIGNQVSVELGRHIPELPVGELLELRIAVMLLGGFFGSRLIKNIREDKGFTYGIHAYLMRLPGGYQLGISSAIGNQYLLEAVEEIHRELARMQETLATKEELEVVQNYLIGMMLRSFDGVFPSTRQLRTLVLQPELPSDYYSRYLAKIRSVQPQDLQRVAKRWLTPKHFTLSAAGAMDNISLLRWPLG